jgi:4-amino-4-deoxy-L-arabinose transferase-like glycosyltransferase
MWGRWRAVASDRWVLAALLLALLVRAVPLAMWPQFECVRDECIYRSIANKIIDGEGLTVSSKGWLPAPGYPYLLALSKIVTGSMQAVKWLQVLLSGLSLVVLASIGTRVAGIRVARVAALLFALNPTLAWFTHTLWIETTYVLLLLCAVESALVARDDDHAASAAVSGAFLGVAVLFRGVATYLPPIFAVALVWPASGRLRDVPAEVRSRFRHVVALGIAAAVVVAPWSIYASPRQGGFLVSDATAGHVLYLGNNDFPPLTFDYGNGMLTGALYSRYLRTGRMPCPRDQPPVLSSQCEVAQARIWATQNEGEFVARVPLRLAQLVNPNSFFTRHLRWGYWQGLPWWAKEGLCVLIVAFGVAIQVGGAVGAWARARGAMAWVTLGTVLYTIAASAVSYGMTRFRVPIEPLLTVYLAMLIAEPRETLAALRADPERLAGAALTALGLMLLMAWFLPTGFPMFW